MKFSQKTFLVGLALALPRLYQEFHLQKPEAQNVDLMCECRDWKAQPMAKGADGLWTITISIPAGNYGYKFLVNGDQWLFDPDNPNRKIVNGVENSAIEVTDDPGTLHSPPRQSRRHQRPFIRIRQRRLRRLSRSHRRPAKP